MLKFAKFIGANTDFSTAQAYLFPRILPEDFSEPVFGLVITGSGEDIFIYVRQKVLNLEDRFSAPFERVTEKLHQLTEVIKSEFSKVENLEFTLFCAKENVFYVLQSGNNIVEVLRGGRLSPVVENQSLQDKVVSGFLQPGDKVIVLSGKPTSKEGLNWGRGIVEQVAHLPIEDVDDAELIFASDKLRSENQEDLAGVKNIEPVAFVLIDNFVPGVAAKEESGFSIPRPKVNLNIRVPQFNLWIFLHKSSRRFLGLFRMNRKMFLVLGVLVLILIVAGSGYWFWKNNNIQKNKRVENLLMAVDSGLNEASGLKDSDSKLAGEKLTQAKDRLKEAESLEKENPRVLELKSRIDEKEAEVLHIYKNVNLDLFISLDLIKDSFKTNRMSYSVGKILLLDPGEKSLVAIDTELKIPNILAGPVQLGNAQMASLNGSHAFVFAPDKGITHVDIDTNLSSSKKASVVSAADPEWGDIKDLFGFSGNVYVLDSGKSKIWKYTPTESGYSGKLDYLKSGANLVRQLADGQKLVIDYSVWVLTSEPEILKFTAGSSDYYAPSGLQEALTQIDDIFVTEDLDSVFILDKSKSRILVTKKNGEYLAQYFSDQFAKIDDFFVDEEEKSIYLLIENKIYKTPLR